MSDLILNERYESLPADRIIAGIFAESSGAACLTCSFQLEDMVVLHLLRQHQPAIPVLFLETGYHFAETYAYRDRMAREWKLNLVNVVPAQAVAEQEQQFGILYRSDPGLCCRLRKVEPLMKALEAYSVWFTGLRREQSPSRRNLRKVEWHQLPTGKQIQKVNPLASWTWDEVSAYASEHRIEHLNLYNQGYRSIGCQPCTAVPLEGADPRSGRWGGTKLECGIHTFSNGAE